jgi:hypothetical protein
MTGSGVLVHLTPVYHAPIRPHPPPSYFLSVPRPYPFSFIHVELVFPPCFSNPLTPYFADIYFHPGFKL